MPKRRQLKWTSIVNNQDFELSVSGQHAHVNVYVRLGEDGMGYNTSRTHTFKLDPVTSQELIAALQQATAIRA